MPGTRRIMVKKDRLGTKEYPSKNWQSVVYEIPHAQNASTAADVLLNKYSGILAEISREIAKGGRKMGSGITMPPESCRVILEQFMIDLYISQGKTDALVQLGKNRQKLVNEVVSYFLESHLYVQHIIVPRDLASLQ